MGYGGNFLNKIFGSFRGGGGGGNVFTKNRYSVPNFLNQGQLSYQNSLDPTSGGKSGDSGFPFAIASLFGSQLIPNPRVPKLPTDFSQFRNQAFGGGPPISQTGQSAISGILNTPFQQVGQDEENAALRGINLEKESELRSLTGLYKSLRPGTDPLTDTTYNRDLGQLNDRYARVQADTLANLHRNAYNNYAQRQLYGGQVAGSLGQQQIGNMQSAIESEYFRPLQAYQASLDKRSSFRDMLQWLPLLFKVYGAR